MNERGAGGRQVPRVHPESVEEWRAWLVENHAVSTAVWLVFWRKAIGGARAQWDAFPPSARRGILEWIVQAKTPATRQKRVDETSLRAGRGERANQWKPKPAPGTEPTPD